MNNDLITKSNEIIQNKTNNSSYLQNQVVAALIANRMSNFVEDEIDMKFTLTRNELLDMLKRKGHGGSTKPLVMNYQNLIKLVYLLGMKNLSVKTANLHKEQCLCPFSKTLLIMQILKK